MPTTACAHGTDSSSLPVTVSDVVRAVLAAGALTLLALPATAQQTPSDQSSSGPLQEVVVTGSLIKRTDLEKIGRASCRERV